MRAEIIRAYTYITNVNYYLNPDMIFPADIIKAYSYLEIKRKASLIIDMETDSVRFYLLCRRCVEAIDFIGKGPVVFQEDMDIV